VSAAGPDPLSDAPIDSSADVGTPLAEESWESIRQGFDRLKQDWNWGTPLFGSSAWSSPLDSSDEDSDSPPAEPEGKGEGDSPGGQGG
jgi:hypothetical protein